MSINILFWNTSRTKINNTLEQLILEKECNIVVLVEYADSVDDLCESLVRHGKAFRPHIVLGCERVTIIQDCCDEITDLQGASRYAIVSMTISRKRYIITGVHFPDRRLADGKARREKTARDLAKDLLRHERNNSCINTIVLGDFNANPFETALIGADCMNAVSDKDIARKTGRRTFERTEYRMLYNPMWNLLGDSYPSGGSYFDVPDDIDSYYWQMIDQVLIHPNLLDQFEDHSLEVVTRTERIGFINRNRRPNKKISDHLPIFFSLKER